KANTCGKQALTMCMGFGCNAVGVTGCRIIDSPRERIIAILTNNFVPCNGRFPTLIAVITMFFIAGATGFAGSFLSAALLCAVILFGIAATLAVSKILSVTLLKGVPSSFTLELPPYRKPQIGKTIIRSVFDRTLFVLGRAVSVAAPAGILIWILANVTAGDKTLLMHFTETLEPLGKLMGMDGVILTAFVLGFPANEIVIPIMLMAYMQNSTLCEYSSLFELHELLVSNGWDMTTALCVMVFSLMHWPCSTTLLTVKKETRSFKWTALAFLIPTLCGTAACIIINAISRIFT
ncbi:MAG: nucleoside recognition domain-containing protein, partial [Candidatus Fimenecus sp.]